MKRTVRNRELRSTRMALQVDAWNGRVVTMEMDPVNATSRFGDRGNVETPSPWIAVWIQAKN